MLNVISTCRDILCVDINVDKRCVDHSSNTNPKMLLTSLPTWSHCSQLMKGGAYNEVEVAEDSSVLYHWSESCTN